MTSQEPAIVMTREEHIDEIISFWRQQRIDRICDDIMFEENERKVARALYEPEWLSEKRPAHILAAVALNSLFWVPIFVIALEILRP